LRAAAFLFGAAFRATVFSDAVVEAFVRDGAFATEAFLAAVFLSGLFLAAVFFVAAAFLRAVNAPSFGEARAPSCTVPKPLAGLPS
jgi:hypothetical protein